MGQSWDGECAKLLFSVTGLLQVDCFCQCKLTLISRTTSGMMLSLCWLFGCAVLCSANQREQWEQRIRPEWRSTMCFSIRLSILVSFIPFLVADPNHTVMNVGRKDGIVE